MDLRRLTRNLFKNLLGFAIDLRLWIRYLVRKTKICDRF